MKEKPMSLSQIYAKGKSNLEKIGFKWAFPPESKSGASVLENRKILDSLFFVPKYFDPVPVETNLNLFGVELRTPAFCSPISVVKPMKSSHLTEIALGVARAGALMMLGIGGYKELQKTIDTGAPVVKMVKPWRKTDLIYKKVRDAERRGCVAVGMDIDHFYGALRGTTILRSDIFGPQDTDELRHLVSETKLPFIFKGILSLTDAKKALQLGASAIIVSNHGRSAIDFTLPSLMALPEIAEGFGQKMTVLIDTGFMTGNDVLKALALGAKAVGFASAMLIAWAAGGASGVEIFVNQITAQLRRSMAATGCPNLAAINRKILRGPGA